MPRDYLASIPATAVERAKLAGLGAPSPGALLGLIQAAPVAFAAYLGADRAASICEYLQSVVAVTGSPDILQTRFRTGAIVDRRVPSRLPEPVTIGLRDELFSELQRLRGRPTRSSAEDRQISELETRLNQLLDGGAS